MGRERKSRAGQGREAERDRLGTRMMRITRLGYSI